ncbi:class I SAM-dependent methyltransferase [Paenibacillus sp. NPDC058071]|uniref:class I SAM-dependent methyltransferase n=1 Tax=Paenibacillus sp. NPDC058071 TaxID=3346326 RepID=UPI0036DC8155
MNKYRSVPPKDNNQLSSEWDAIALTRAEQIEKNIDISFKHVLLPYIESSLMAHSRRLVLDIGCGTGFLTYQLSKVCDRIIGVDLSNKSIQIAKEKFSTSNTTYFLTSIEDYSISVTRSMFSLAVANMTLMDVKNLFEVVNSVSKVLMNGGHFIFTITHPHFWPFYWGYYDEPWFDYKKEIFIEAPFHISLDSSNNNITTHVHRPLEMYINTLTNNGFVIDEINELMPEDTKVQEKYNTAWKYPRFLGVKCHLEK